MTADRPIPKAPSRRVMKAALAAAQQPLETVIAPIPAKLKPLFEPYRYKVAHGGRGGTKSWNFARALLILGTQSCLRVLCVRELQTSIQESVHKLLTDQIGLLGLGGFYRVTQTSIEGINGTEFFFKGVRNNAAEIKSTEGVDICWVEEAEKVSDASWRLLIPTIRKAGSEIWISFNPNDKDDPTYKRFVLNTPPDAVVIEINWRDNPWFPEELEKERQYALSLIETAKDEHERAQAQADYDHVWEGKVRLNTMAGVIKRWRVEAFDTPEDVRFFHGADWGFANDPTCLLRCFVDESTNILYVDRESFGYGVELDEIPQLFDAIPTARKWPIKADNARPETISHIKRKGFNISAADKWAGSIEDGIAHLNAFRMIVIHPRCRHLINEARLYSYKVDKVTQEILPVIVDAHNHGWDALRYALDKYIQRRGGTGVWAKLG